MRKIMFNDRYGLTQAVLDGRKTPTRRICKEQHWSFSDLVNANENDSFLFEQPKYRKGEAVAIAQAYREIAHPNDGFLDDRYEVKDEYVAGWSNKMFVRADLMPHRIRITDVRVERLNDISDDDCIAEGVLHSDKYAMPYGIPDSKAPNGIDFYYSTPHEAYAALIDKISGKGTFESNPYVFVYEFELVK